MTSAALIGLIGFFVLVGLILIRFPVYLSMVFVGVLGNAMLAETTPHFQFTHYLLQYKTLLWNFFSSYHLSILPLFILMGYLAEELGISKDLFRGMNFFLKKFRGGLGIATIASAACLGTISGSSLATTATVSKVAFQQLKKYRYQSDLISGIIASGGTLGILIPPSFVLIIYAALVQISVIKMFKAAIFPAALAVFFFALVVYGKSAKRGPSASPASKAQAKTNGETFISHSFISHLKALLPVAVLFFLVFWGMYFGWFSPVEAASVGVFAVLVYGLIKKNSLTKSKLKKSLLATVNYTAMIYFILLGAEILKGFFTRSTLPIHLVELLAGLDWNPGLIIVMILLFLIFLGCFLESLTIVLIFVPFFLPVLTELASSHDESLLSSFLSLTPEQLKIWFGILMLIVIEIGLITPPVGLNLFIIKKTIPSIPFEKIYLGVVPFLLVEVIRILIILFFPAIVFLL